MKRTILLTLLLVTGCIAPLAFMVPDATLPQTITAWGYVYNQHDYDHYGYIVRAMQPGLSETSVTNYNGFVAFSFINPLLPSRIDILDRHGSIVLSQQEQQLSTPFTIPLPGQNNITPLMITIIGLISALVFLSLSILIITRKEHRWRGVPYLLLTSAAVSYYGVTFIQQIMAYSNHEIQAGTIFALHRIGFLFFPPAFYHFSHMFLESQQRPPRHVYLAYLPLLVFIPVLLSWPLCGSDTLFESFWRFTFNDFIQAFNLYACVFITAGLTVLVMGYREYPGKHLRVLITGVLTALLLLIVTLIVPQLFLLREPFHHYYQSIVLFSQLIFFGTLAYSIVKHHIIDITFLINKALLYLLLAAVFATAYIVILNTVLVIAGPEKPLLVSLILPVILFIFFEPIRFHLQKMLDRFFYPDHTLIKSVMDSYFTTVAPVLDRYELCRQIQKLHQDFVPGSCMDVYLYDKNKKRMNLLSKEANPPALDLSQRDVELFLSSPIVLWNVQSKTGGPAEKKDGNYEFAIPLIFNNELIGCLAYCRKTSLTPYSHSQKRLLLSLSRYFAISFFNCLQNERIMQTERSLFHTEKLAALGRITASIAHEVKNPLATILPLIKVFPDMRRDETFIADFMDIVPRQLERIDTKVRSLLSYAKPGSANIFPGNIEDVVTEVVVSMTYQLKKKNIQVVTSLNGKKAIQFDRDDMAAVFTNVLLNAMEAIGANGTITITSTDSESRKIIQCHDSGEGIPEDLITKVFEPFYSTKTTGTGIGLSTSSRIIQAHGGTITVSSEQGKGTTFTIQLPLLDTEALHLGNERGT